MEQHSEETPASTDASSSTEAAPVRRRASRRVTAAAGESSAVEVTSDAASDASAPEAAPAAASAASAATVAEETSAPKKRVSRARKKTDSTEAVETVGSANAVEEPAPQAASQSAAATEGEGAPKASTKRATRSSSRAKKSEASTEPASSAESAVDSTTQDRGENTDHRDADAPVRDEATSRAADTTTEQDSESEAPTRRRNGRGRGRKSSAHGAGSDVAGDQSSSESAAGASSESESESDDQSEQGESSSPSGASSQSGKSDGNARSSRTRQRERKRRGGNDDEPELTEDDVLLPIAGILDVLDNYAFVRTSGYLPGTGDVYVSLGQVKKYGLRKGDAVVGAIRQPREGEGGGRQKYNAIVKVDSINSLPIEEEQKRSDFADLTPIYANERLRLETTADQLGARVVDLFSPIGKGQRGLIIGPHESGKSTTLQTIAQAVAANAPDTHLMMVLVDERPEEVTELQRTMNGEVIASTFDRPAEDHTTIAELAIERAKRLVELGHDVVVLIDSLTDLARAYNLSAPASVRVPAGSLDAAAVFPVKRLLSAARNIENGGSLTILATLSAQPGSQLDDALIGELEGVANMQLRLSGDAADRRVYPAVDVLRSSTRNAATLTSEAEARVIDQLRKSLQGHSVLENIERVLHDVSATSSNVEFLAQTQRSQSE